MTLWRRIRTYLVGVGLGLIIVYVMFGDRELNTWTPEKRIMTTIDSSVVTISDRAKCQLICLDLNQQQWVEIQHASSVNFSESATDKKPCPIYRLEMKNDSANYLMVWEVCENAEEVELMSIAKGGVNCDC